MHPWRHRGGVWGLQNPRGEGKLHATISYTGWQRIMAFSIYQRTKEETRRLHAACPTPSPAKMEVCRDMLPHPGSWVSGKGGANRKWGFEEGKRGADPNCLRNFVNFGYKWVTGIENTRVGILKYYTVCKIISGWFFVLHILLFHSSSCVYYMKPNPRSYAIFYFILGSDLIHELCI